MNTKCKKHESIGISILLFSFVIILPLCYYVFNQETSLIISYIIMSKTSNSSDVIQNISAVDGYNRSFFPFYIFQIGFNKAGTTTLYSLFRKNEIPSIHWNMPTEYKPNINGIKNLKILMQYGYKHNELFLYDLPYHYRYYGDFGLSPTKNCNENENIPYYKLLLQRYSQHDMKFILNIRNVNHWVRSRFFHRSIGSLLRYGCNKTMDEIDAVHLVKNNWYSYICNLLQYFKQNKILDNLLIYDIENESLDKVVKYFEKYNLILKHKNETNSIYNPTYKGVTNISLLQKWQTIIDKDPNLIEDGYNSEYDRISNICNISVAYLV